MSSILISDQVFFHSIHVPCLLLKSNYPHFDVLDANKAYLNVTNTSLADIKGKGLFEVFPDNPRDQVNTSSTILAANLKKVIETRKPQQLFAHKYDILIEETGEFEVRYWNAVNSPVFNDNGEVVSIIHSAEDVTESVILKKSEREILNVIKYNREATRSLLEKNPDAVLTLDLNGNFTFVNQRFLNLSGYEMSDLLENPFLSFITENYRNHAGLFLENVKQGNSDTKVLEIIAKTQESIPFAITSAPVTVAGELTAVFLIAKEISEDIIDIHFSEDTLTKYAPLATEMKTCKAIIDAEGVCKEVEPAISAILGFNEDYYKEKSIFSLVPETEKDSLLSRYKEVLLSEEAVIGTYRFIHENGTYRWVKMHLYDQREKTNDVTVVFQDITEEISKEIKLEKALYEIDKIFESSLDMICTIDINGLFKRVSDASFKMLGYFPSELENKKYMDLVHPEDKQKTEDVSREIMSGLKTSSFQNRYIRKDGEVIYIVWTAQWDNKSELMYCIARDESERIKTEQVLRKERKNLEISNERYEYLKKATNDAIWDWDLKTNRIIWGEGFYTLFGYDPEKMSNNIEEWMHHIHPGDLYRVMQSLNKVIDGEENFWQDKYRYRKANGDFVIVSDRGYVIRRSDGKGRRMIGAMQDITESEKREAERRIALEIDEYFYQDKPLEFILDQVLHLLLNYTGHQIAEIWVSNFDKSSLLLLSQVSIDRSHIYDGEIMTFDPNVGLPGKCWTERKEVIVENLELDVIFIRKEFARTNNLRSAKALPLFYQGEVIAVVGFFSKYPYSKSDFDLFGEYLGERLAANIKRKQIEIELNSFFELSPDLLSVISSEGIFNKVNRAFSDLLGYTTADILNTSFFDYIHDGDRKNAEGEFRKIKQGYALHNYECRYKTRAGTYLWLLWNAMPNKKENVVYAVAIDITLRKKTEQELQKAYAEKNGILESIGDAFFAVDENFIVTYWNSQAEVFLNQWKEDVLGKNLWDIFPEAVGTSYYTNYRRALHEQVSIHFEEFFAPLEKWFDLSVYPQQNGVLVFFRDITEKKKLTEQFESVIKNIPGVIYRCLIHPKLALTYLSPRVLELTEYAATDLLDEKQVSFIDIILDEDLHRLFNIQKQLTDTEIFKIEYRIKTKSGTIKWVQDSGRGIYDRHNKLLFIDGVIIDITEQKSAELRLKELNLLLEKQTNDLMVSNAELEQFAYVASHDLQEPLRMVTSFLSLLEKKYGVSLDDKAKEYIRFAVDGAKNMRAVILDLLEYSRSGRESLEFEVIDLNELIGDVLKLFRNQLETTNALVDYNQLPRLSLPRTQMMQVFQNLIGNSLKYRSENRVPRINIRVTEKEKDWQFSVKDNGIGIKAEYLNQIFAIFQRLHHKEEYTGNGVGLAICKKIIQNLDGEIWAESKYGEGTTIFFTIPKRNDETY